MLKQFQKYLLPILWPFSWIYGGIMCLRTYFYEMGWFKRSATPVFSVGVGNITVGGTGKTPFVEFLIQGMFKQRSIATLSRGYGRKTKGFRVVQEGETAETVGDEPWQIYQKFKSHIHCYVGENRVDAVQQIVKVNPRIQTILLDDAFQHQAIQLDYSIVLCDYHQPFYKDYPFPAGRLREGRSAVQRAHVVVVTKCPSSISQEEQQQMMHQIQRYAKREIPVYFTSIVYREPVSIHVSSSKEIHHWLLVTGIANPRPLNTYLRSQNNLWNHLEFSDHEPFEEAHCKRIIEEYQKANHHHLGVLLTEKDYYRLSEANLLALSSIPLYYIPIRFYFISKEEEFYKSMDKAYQKKRELLNNA
jgi:tetraacyldisaccharide 4'-kinase